MNKTQNINDIQARLVYFLIKKIVTDTVTDTCVTDSKWFVRRY